jgi:hypothetical protein
MGPPTRDILVKRNRVFYCDLAGIAVATELTNLVENVTIANNCVAYCLTEGIIVADWVNNGLRRNISIINNTVFNCASLYGGGIQIRTDQVENIIIRNNIVSQNDRFQIAVLPGAASQVSVDYNLINGSQIHADAVYGDSAVLGDPGFSNPSVYDFTLTESSPAIDAGHPDSVYNDPDGTRSDIGAYYFDQLPDWFCGDANSDTKVNVSDAVFIINYAFAAGPAPQPLEAADCNCDSKVNISDAVYIINYAFAGGNPPCDPDGDGYIDCYQFQILNTSF